MLHQNLGGKFGDFDTIDVDRRGGNQYRRRLTSVIVLQRLIDFRSRKVTVELLAQQLEEGFLLDLGLTVLSASRGVLQSVICPSTLVQVGVWREGPGSVLGIRHAKELDRHEGFPPEQYSPFEVQSVNAYSTNLLT